MYIITYAPRREKQAFVTATRGFQGEINTPNPSDYSGSHPFSGLARLYGDGPVPDWLFPVEEHQRRVNLNPARKDSLSKHPCWTSPVPSGSKHTPQHTDQAGRERLHFHTPFTWDSGGNTVWPISSVCIVKNETNTEHGTGYFLDVKSHSTGKQSGPNRLYTHAFT